MNNINDNKRNHYSFLIYLINCVVNEKQPDAIYDNINWMSIYKISNEAMLASVIYEKVIYCKNKYTISDEVISLFEESYNQNIYRETIQQYESNKIINFCEENKIKNILLKGSVLKYDYPKTHLRVMSDVDIWIEQAGIKKTDEYLQKNGYTLKGKRALHIKYIKNPVMICEIHNMITDSTDEVVSEYLNNNLLNNLIKVDDNYNYAYKMNPVDLYLNLLDHCIKHMNGGGISIKMIIDFYIFNKVYYNKMTKKEKNKLETLVNEFGYKELNYMITELALNWFSPECKITINDEFSNSIIDNKAFGTKENLVINSEKNKNIFYYTLRWLFPSKKMLLEEYYSLRKKPSLFPLYYFKWWGDKFDIYVIKRKKSYKHIKSINKIINKNK